MLQRAKRAKQGTPVRACRPAKRLADDRVPQADDSECEDPGFEGDDCESFDAMALVATKPEEIAFEVHDVFAAERITVHDDDDDVIEEYCFLCFFDKINQTDSLVRQTIRDLESRALNMAASTACKTHAIYKIYKNNIQPTLVTYGCPVWTRRSISDHLSALHKTSLPVLKERYIEFSAKAMDLLQRNAFVRNKATGAIQPQFGHLKMIDKMANTVFSKIG
jgi:hypothetical protein